MRHHDPYRLGAKLQDGLDSAGVLAAFVMNTEENRAAESVIPRLVN
jgi:hypothetical protein